MQPSDIVPSPPAPASWVSYHSPSIAMRVDGQRGLAPTLSRWRGRAVGTLREMTSLVPVWAVFVAGCAAPPAQPPAPGLSTIEERLTTLDDRVNTLERLLTNLPSPPMRSRAEIFRNLQSLEKQRAVLLERYTATHPDVREVDLRLRLVRLQLDMYDQVNRMSP